MQSLHDNAYIGRRATLDALDRWGREAAAGDPRLVVVSGAAGIGKSRLLARHLDRQRTRSATVLAGACHQGATVPYLPVVSALHLLLDRPTAPASTGRALRDVLTAVPQPGADPSAVSGEAHRLELFLSAAAAVTDAARVGPVILAIEDLQWADQPSLELLAHLVSTVAQEARLGPLPVLIVLTRRDSPMAPAGEQLMFRVGREAIHRELVLTGLTELETNGLLTQLLGARPSGQLLLAVQEATAGNPLFIGWLCRMMDEEGRLRHGDGVVEATTEDLLGLPSDLDEALMDSIAALSDSGRDLARRAAFLGAEGTLSDLAAVSELDADALEAALHELDRAGIIVAGTIEAGGPGYRFTHPQIRQLLYQANVPGRAELHRLIADRLAASGAEPGQVAMGIAYHLRRAGPDVDRGRLLAAATLAGDTAFALGAWAKAARELSSALDAGSAPGLLTDRERAALEERAGTASFRDHDLVEARRHAERAVDLARAAGDLERWGSALSLAMRTRFAHGADTVGRAGDASPIEEYLQAAGDEQPVLRARLLGELAEMSFAAFDVRTGRDLALRALTLAESTDDHGLIGEIRFALGLADLGALDLVEARQSFEASVEHARLADDPWQTAWGLGRLPLVSLARGELARTEAELNEQVQLTGRTRDWAELSLATALRTAIASARGDYAAVESLAGETEQLYARSAFAFTPAVLYPALAMSRARRGDGRGAAEALARWQAEAGASTWRYELAAVLAAGHRDEARERLASRAYTPSRQLLTFFSADGVTADVEVATLGDDQGLASSALAQLDQLRSDGVLVLPGSGAFVPRLIGQALLTLGRDEEARDTLEGALEMAGRSGLAPEEARCGYELARVLATTAADDREAIVTILHAAMARADRLGMLPLLSACHDLFRTTVDRGRMATAVLPPRTRVILVSDLVGSTALNVKAGDAVWADRMGRHDLILRACLRRHGGVEFKHTGDGLCAWFDSAAAAVDCADDIRRQLAEATVEDPDLGLVPRLGLASGQPIGVGDDLFGLAIALATRLCAAAAPESILASEEVARMAVDSGVELIAGGALALKGFPEPVAVFSSGPAVASAPARFDVDD